MCINVRDKAVAAPQQDDRGVIQMKDERQLHGASPKLSLRHVAVKSDLQMEEEGKVSVRNDERENRRALVRSLISLSRAIIISKIGKEVCKSYFDVRLSVKMNTSDCWLCFTVSRISVILL